MDFFNKLGDVISETGKDVSQKVSDLTGIARLNMDVRKREDFVKKQYTEIGKQYYELHKEDEEPFFEEIKLIRETLQEIDELKIQIADLKGKKKCPACGTVNEGDAVYCTKCGAKCESIFQEEDSEEQVETQKEEEIIIEEIKEDIK